MDGTTPIELRRGPLRFTGWVTPEPSQPSQPSQPAELVICLHGFPDHPRSFRDQLPALREAGYRVLVPTLRGYEPSSQPSDGRYFMVDLVEDLIAWIDRFSGGAPVHLIGHDWGAVIAYAMAATAPERLRSLVTLAVPQLRRLVRAPARMVPIQLRKSGYMGLFQLPGIADWALAREHGELIAQLWRRWSPTWEPPPAELDAVLETFARPGVRAAALGYYRCNLLRPGPSMLAGWRRLLQPTPTPTLTITGAADGCMDTRLFDHPGGGGWRSDYRGPVELLRVADAGHFVHQERPEQVNPAILAWLRQT
jgi:pimeloyl-ACP methyl ester carboxylesterase